MIEEFRLEAKNDWMVVGRDSSSLGFVEKRYCSAVGSVKTLHV